MRIRWDIEQRLSEGTEREGSFKLLLRLVAVITAGFTLGRPDLSSPHNILYMPSNEGATFLLPSANVKVM
jgi:hypothetical protein